MHVEKERGTVGENGSANDDVTRKGEGDRNVRFETRIGNAVGSIKGSNIAPRKSFEEGCTDDMIGKENEKLTDVVQTGIPEETDDKVKIVEVWEAKGAKDGELVVTPIASGAPQVKEEMDNAVEIGNVYGDGVYAKSAKGDERKEQGGSKIRALQKMHGVEAAVTGYDGVQVTTQRKTDVIEEEGRNVCAKEGRVKKTVAEEHRVDERVKLVGTLQWR